MITTPFGLPGGDTNSDGDCDASDVTQVDTWSESTTYDVRGDIDLDGDVDVYDSGTISDDYSGITLGRGVLSEDEVGNRRAFSGHATTASSEGLLARNRMLTGSSGRWASRDPLGYLDSANLYQYTGSMPVAYNDPSGLVKCETAFVSWLNFHHTVDIDSGNDSITRHSKKLIDELTAKGDKWFKNYALKDFQCDECPPLSPGWEPYRCEQKVIVLAYWWICVPTNAQGPRYSGGGSIADIPIPKFPAKKKPRKSDLTFPSKHGYPFGGPYLSLWDCEFTGAYYGACGKCY